MWSYKNCYLIVIAYIALAVFSNTFGVRYLSYQLFDIGINNWIVFISHLLVTFTVIVTLKRFKESLWRTVPFYISVLAGGIFFVLNPRIVPQLTEPHELITFYSVVGIIFALIDIYIVINAFLIKHKEISFYFKIYGSLLLFSTTMIYASPFVFRYSLGLIVWQRYFSVIMNLMPPFALLVLYLNLHNKISRFRVSDIVAIKKDIENIPARSHGVIVSKYAERGYYEVEFSDGQGRLLEVLTVSSKDIEHIAEPDLQTRVEAFGK